MTEETLKVVTKDVYEEVKGGAKEAAKGQKELAKATDKTTKATDKGRATMKDMNFEFLGVMFFGQNVAKVFGEMLKPALDLFGVMDLWGLTLKVVFLPVIEAIFPILLNIMELFMDLSPEMKLALGWFALIGFGLGLIMGIIGTVVLGIQSIAIGFTGALVPLAGVATVVLAAIALIVAAIAFAIFAWKTDFGDFKTNIKEIFSGIKDIIEDVMGIITGFIDSDAEKMHESFVSLIDDLKVLWLSFQEFLLDLFVQILAEAVKIPFRVIKIISGIAGFQGGVDFADQSMDLIDLVANNIVDFDTSGFLRGDVQPGGAGGGAGGPTINNVNISVSGVSSPDDVKRIADGVVNDLIDKLDGTSSGASGR